MAVCNLKNHFTSVDIGDSGYKYGGKFLTNNFLGFAIENNTFNIPKIAQFQKIYRCFCRRRFVCIKRIVNETLPITGSYSCGKLLLITDYHCLGG